MAVNLPKAKLQQHQQLRKAREKLLLKVETDLAHPREIQEMVLITHL